MKITFDSSGLDQTNGEFQRRSKLADAAQQFEAMLWQEMLKPMRNGDAEFNVSKAPASMRRSATRQMATMIRPSNSGPSTSLRL